MVKAKVGKHSVWMFHGDDASSYAPIRYNCSDPFALLLFPRNRPTQVVIPNAVRMLTALGRGSPHHVYHFDLSNHKINGNQIHPLEAFSHFKFGNSNSEIQSFRQV